MAEGAGQDAEGEEVTIESELIAPDGALENDLIEVVNKHIQASGLRPEVGVETVTIMALDMLKALSWLPGNLRAAQRCLQEALGHVRAG